MTHLLDDQLFELAACSAEYIPFSEAQLQQLEHLKTCTECYEKYCVFSAIADATGEAAAYSGIFQPAAEPVAETATTIPGKILAVLRIVRNQAHAATELLAEQLNQASAALQFAPVPVSASRGSAGKAAVLRMEEFEHEDTYLAFDSIAGSLIVQINTKQLDSDDLCVALSFESQFELKMPLEKHGSLLRGRMDNLPDKSFTVTIEER